MSQRPFALADASSPWADVATAPVDQAALDAPGAGPRYRRVSVRDVRHEHTLAVRQRRVDTQIIHWAPEGADTEGGRHIIEKSLIEMPDWSAAAAVALEKASIRRLMDLGLPCAPIADPAPLPNAASDLSLFVEYAGPSLDELLRHPLKDAEYANAIAAVCRSLHRYAQQGAFPVDTSPRNFCIGLTAVTRGRIDFSRSALIDHRHTRFVGTASSQPWPDLGLPKGAAPEVEQRLSRDATLDLRVMMPGCPVSVWSQLRHLPPPERDLWMSKIKSPHLGGALDDGSLNVDAALQALFVSGLCALQVPTVLRSQQPCSQAIEFMQRRKAVTDRMLAADPGHRFPSLEDAAQAWLSGSPTLQFSSTEIGLDPRQRQTVEGASQPFDDEAWPASAAGADHGTASTPRHDRPTETQRPPSRLRQPLFPLRSWYAGIAPRKAAATALFTLAMGGVFLSSGLTAAPTPERLLEATQLTEVGRLARIVKTEKRAEPRMAAIERLLQIAHTSDSQRTRQRAMDILAASWRTLQLELQHKPGAATDPSTARGRAILEATAWGNLGYPPAARWAGRVSGRG